MICRDKSKFDKKSARKKIESSLKHNYFWSGREYPYKKVKPRIIAEKYMEDKKNEELIDYKIFCFEGKFGFIMTCTERYGQGLKVTFFDNKWNRMDFHQNYPVSSKDIPKPKNLKKMIEFSEKLSEGIHHLRVDFYEINGELFFGELTFFDSSGFEKFVPNKWNYYFGNMIELPDKSEM